MSTKSQTQTGNVDAGANGNHFSPSPEAKVGNEYMNIFDIDSKVGRMVDYSCPLCHGDSLQDSPRHNFSRMCVKCNCCWYIVFGAGGRQRWPRIHIVQLPTTVDMPEWRELGEPY